MADLFDDAAIGAVVGTHEQLFDDIAAGKSRLIYIIDPDAGTAAIFGFQSVAGGFKVRHRDGRHIGSFADLGAALEAGAVATGAVPPTARRKWPHDRWGRDLPATMALLKRR